MTITPLIAPQSAPAASTPTIPSATSIGDPFTIEAARQFVRVKVMPTERSIPAVSTTKVCAIATNARSTALLAAVLTTFDTDVVVKPCDAIAG